MDESLAREAPAPFPPQFIAVCGPQAVGWGRGLSYHRWDGSTRRSIAPRLDSRVGNGGIHQVLSIGWGCASQTQARGKTARKQAETENGAGIAADPTLTDAWSCARGHLNLASGVSPFHRGQAASDRLYHRRSHRHPDPPSCGYFHPVRWTRRSAPLSGKLPRSTGGSAVGLSLVAGFRKLRVASIRRPRRTPLPLSDRTIRPVSKTFGASSSPAFPPGTEVRRQSASKAAWTGFLHVFPA